MKDYINVTMEAWRRLWELRLGRVLGRLVRVVELLETT